MIFTSDSIFQMLTRYTDYILSNHNKFFSLIFAKDFSILKKLSSIWLEQTDERKSVLTDLVCQHLEKSKLVKFSFSGN